MIQFNLLPNVKLEYIKTKRLKRIMAVFSIGVIAFSVGLVIMLFLFQAVQAKHLNDLNNDVAKYTKQLNDTPDLTRILSIQNQLSALPALYQARPGADRLGGYVEQTTPANVTIGKLTADFEASTLKIEGTAPTLERVNSFIDTLKYSNYQVYEEGVPVSDAAQAFKDVVMSDFTRNADQATYMIDLTFDSTIFDITKDSRLTVPQLVTTHAQVPSIDLFKELVKPTSQTDQGGKQ